MPEKRTQGEPTDAQLAVFAEVIEELFGDGTYVVINILSTPDGGSAVIPMSNVPPESLVFDKVREMVGRAIDKMETGEMKPLDPSTEA